MGYETRDEQQQQQQQQPPPPPPPPPPLPPRPGGAPAALATTAVTPVDIQTLSFPDGSRGTFSNTASSPDGSGHISPNHPKASTDDAASVMSFAPTMRPAADIASLLTGSLNRPSPAWTMLHAQAASVGPFESGPARTNDRLAQFHIEFEPLPDDDDPQFNDEDRLALWKSKLKHYMILSSAGKPVWSRHGDLNLINSSIGVVQTIISFYEDAQNPLRGFTAGDTRFAVLTQGPLYLVAISKLGESDSQLRSQLEALYMQILSTLTLPTLTNVFVNRPSSDLRKPLQGTQSLLSSLADSFTKGSVSALLGSLECLKLPKSERHSINNTFLKLRSPAVLYGLIVSGGRLVSVVRPRRHSLHPSDLQLIFNMLFESDGIKGGGGENWIPICLPAFNNQGYLYMYVSFFEGVSGEQATASAASQGRSAAEEIAMVLISADRESFFSLKQMRDDVARQLAKNGSLSAIMRAARAGRPSVSQVAPGSQISHFLYKSRANVQFCMASLKPWFAGLVKRRRLMELYHELHAAAHAKHAHLKVLHCAGPDTTSLAWVTSVFEFYCVGGPHISRESMLQGANKIIQWAKKEEQRLFIIGGGVF
ncbi:hypothetical protein L249_3590 [Ophiocordyceps polyrhachis-furcata BCC 54312]|uniref:Vacuolar fusion protein MON1 n=1 Tax=Ophiocordyceps polyrhachis-furcata BCC 54312 TaxID=1330021 RepID=A0A367LM03_9HYPO|nr:hypothetical protein L249_3590 [Ophiocordyceps polyrhachis-furcata BCC 54312]